MGVGMRADVGVGVGGCGWVWASLGIPYFPGQGQLTHRKFKACTPTIRVKNS